MGNFDTIMVPCPVCGERSGFQSKSGECLLDVYNLEDCPEEVLGGVNLNAPNLCEKCHTEYYVQLNPIPIVWDKSRKEVI